MNDPTSTQPRDHTSGHSSDRSPTLTRRRLLQTGAGVVALGAAAVGVDAVRGGNGSYGLVGANATPIGPNSPEVLAAERARSKSGQLVRRTLIARPGAVDLAGKNARTWLFDEAMPTGEIRLTARDELQVDVVNELPDPTTVHWHGVALRNDMDGVPGLNMKAIEPGDSFRYQFTAPHPGTYWFHPHVGVQLDTGLIGALIIEDPSEPLSYDRDVTLVLDDWTDGVGDGPKKILADQAANGMPGGGMDGMERAWMAWARAWAWGAWASRPTSPWGRTPATSPTRCTWSTAACPRTPGCSTRSPANGCDSA